MSCKHRKCIQNVTVSDGVVAAVSGYRYSRESSAKGTAFARRVRGGAANFLHAKYFLYKKCTGIIEK
jgi:hypothetical protein